MKIKVSTSPIYNLILFIAIIDCGFFAALQIPFIGDWGVCRTMFAAVAIGLFVNCIANKKINNALKPYNNFINFYTILIMLFIVIVGIYSYIQYEQTFLNIFVCYRNFLFMFLISPLIYIFTKQNGYDKLIRVLVVLVFVYITIEIFVALFYNVTGILLIEKMKFGFRNGRLRCTDPELFSIAVPYVAFRFFKEKKAEKRVVWFLIFSYVFFYLIYVNMTRILIVSVLVCFLVVGLFKPRPKSTQFVVWVFAGLGILLLVVSGVLGNFIGSFSQTNTETGGSTYARQFAVEYYSTYTHKNPIFSMGFVCPTNDYFKAIFNGPNSICSFDDLGIRGMWYHFGILGVILAVVIFIRLFYLFIKSYYIKKSDNRLFIAGLLAYLVISQVSLSAFDIQRTIMFTIIWAIFEYEAHTDRENKQAPKIVRRPKTLINIK